MPLTGDMSAEALLGLYLNPDRYASNQSNPSSTESFTQYISWWNCADCRIPPFTLGCVSVCGCKVPINQIWCHFLQFTQDLRQALNRKQWFIFSSPPFSPAGFRNAAVHLPCITHEVARLARGWNHLCASFPGFCQILFWSSFSVPCTTATVRYLFKLAVCRNTTIKENCAQLSKCFFTWITLGSLEGVGETFLLILLLGLSVSVFLNKLLDVWTFIVR